MTGESWFWLGFVAGVLAVIGLAGVGAVLLWLWGMEDWRRFGAP